MRLGHHANGSKIATTGNAQLLCGKMGIFTAPKSRPQYKIPLLFCLKD